MHLHTILGSWEWRLVPLKEEEKKKTRTLTNPTLSNPRLEFSNFKVLMIFFLVLSKRLPMILVLSLCRRQSTIRVRMRSVTKPATPPVTIPSTGTSTRDCRNSGKNQVQKPRDNFVDLFKLLLLNICVYWDRFSSNASYGLWYFCTTT